MAVTHAKVSSKADVVDATLVRPSDWNAAHVGTNDVVQSSPVRVLDTEYQNTSGKIRIVAIALKYGVAGLPDIPLSSCYVTAKNGVVSGALFTIANDGIYSVALADLTGISVMYDVGTLTFIVPPGYYFKAEKTLSGSGVEPIIITWTEWDLL